VTAGYRYDALGRTLTVPAVDAAGIGAHAADAGALGLGYYANDMVATEAQGSAQVTFTLDPTQNRILTAGDGATTTTNHYTGGSDAPAWTSTGPETWTRDIMGIDGGLAATVDQAGAVVLHLANPHGDVIATVDDDPAALGVIGYAEYTEYGAPRDAVTAPQPYGWSGGRQAPDQGLGGLVVMGVRLYDPATGRFLSVDPVSGASANAYDYCGQDPVNRTDRSGMTWYYRGHQTVYAKTVFQWGSWHLRWHNHFWDVVNRIPPHVTVLTDLWYRFGVRYRYYRVYHLYVRSKWENYGGLYCGLFPGNCKRVLYGWQIVARGVTEWRGDWFSAVYWAWWTWHSYSYDYSWKEVWFFRA
jgi:RHS repeat-associated protein